MASASLLNYFLLTILGSVGGVYFLRHIRRYNTEKQKYWLNFALVLVASVYLMFAIVSLNTFWITIELVGMVFFLLFIGLAIKYSYWFLALGWLLHVFWNTGILPGDIAPYIPLWYPAVALGFDFVVAVYVTVKIANSG